MPGDLGQAFLLGSIIRALLVGEIGGMVASTAFLGMFLFGTALGIALLPTRRRTPAAWALTSTLVAIGLMVVLGLTAPNWVHPAYPETVVHFGVALLALPQLRRR